MTATFSHRGMWLLVVAGTWLLLLSLGAGRAAALTPDSPEVRTAVAKGVKFLESSKPDDRMGAKALIGLAILKANGNKNHPRVIEAGNAARRQVSPNMDLNLLGDHRIYQLAMTGIFLIECDPKQYSEQIRTILMLLERLQKPFGGWGYHETHKYARTSDTSMTQYGVLCAWEATHAGFEVRSSMVERSLVWLMKTQDPSGGWGYQGRVSNSLEPIPQELQTPSLTVAGLGSVYACTDLLFAEEPESDLPPALVAVDDSGAALRTRRTLVARPDKLPVTMGQINTVESRGNGWMAANFTIDPKVWTYYYLYGLERYQSFREAAEGDETWAPEWYDKGAEFLITTQSKSGSWPTDYPQAAEQPITTSFAILFLVRSMKKSLDKARNFGSGMLIGGRGLPKDTDAVVVRDGSVMSIPEAESVEAVLSAVDDDSDPGQFEKIEALAAMKSDDAVPLIDKHAQRLRELAGGASPEARLAAVSALAKRRNIDDVPVLIYALTDPDPAVVLEARDGLRRISRKFHGFGLPDNFTDAQRRTAVAQWKEWFLKVRPNAEFTE